MALNTRGVLDPRFPYFARAAAVSGMLAEIEINKPVKSDTWNPANGDVYSGVYSYTPLYKGRARVQPNKDWRARKQRWEGTTFTEHAVRIQLDLTGNTITTPEPLPDPQLGEPGHTPLPGDAGIIHVNDVVKVTKVLASYGYPVDGMLMVYTFIVRNVVPTSNSWVRTILCDVNVNDVDGYQ